MSGWEQLDPDLPKRHLVDRLVAQRVESHGIRLRRGVRGLMARLESAGFRVIKPPPALALVDIVYRKKWKSTKDAATWEEWRRIAGARVLNAVEFEELKRNPDPSQEDADACSRFVAARALRRDDIDATMIAWVIGDENERTPRLFALWRNGALRVDDVAKIASARRFDRELADLVGGLTDILGIDRERLTGRWDAETRVRALKHIVEHAERFVACRVPIPYRKTTRGKVVDSEKVLASSAAGVRRILNLVGLEQEAVGSKKPRDYQVAQGYKPMQWCREADPIAADVFAVIVTPRESWKFADLLRKHKRLPLSPSAFAKLRKCSARQAKRDIAEIRATLPDGVVIARGFGGAEWVGLRMT